MLIQLYHWHIKEYNNVQYEIKMIYNIIMFIICLWVIYSGIRIMHFTTGPRPMDWINQTGFLKRSAVSGRFHNLKLSFCQIIVANGGFPILTMPCYMATDNVNCESSPVYFLWMHLINDGFFCRIWIRTGFLLFVFQYDCSSQLNRHDN